MSAALAAIAVFPVLTLLLVGLSKAEGLLYAPAAKNGRSEPAYEPAEAQSVVAEVAEAAVSVVQAVADTVAPVAEPAPAPVPVVAPEPAVAAVASTPAPETRPLPRLRSVEASSLHKISLSSLARIRVEA